MVHDLDGYLPVITWCPHDRIGRWTKQLEGRRLFGEDKFLLAEWFDQSLVVALWIDFVFDGVMIDEGELSREGWLRLERF